MAVMTQAASVALAGVLRMQQPQRVRGQSAGRSYQPVCNSLRNRVHVQTVFPGEDAPGSGLRVFPEEVYNEPPHLCDLDHFDMKTTEECYKEFEALALAGSRRQGPAQAPADTEPAGFTALKMLDEGPFSGNRKRPCNVDERAAEAVLPRPNQEESVAARLIEIEARKGGC